MSAEPGQPGVQLSDEQLLTLYRMGQKRAFTLLTERYKLELFHFLYRFVMSKEVAEDLFQEAFLQVHISADSFDNTKRFRPWLFTIAANKARDHLRKVGRQQELSHSAPVSASSPESGDLIDLLAGDFELPHDQLQRDDTRKRVRQVIAALPDHMREILVLGYFHQMPYKDISESLGVPLGTVKSRLHAAVTAFATAWKTKYKEDE
jgi:RNA polymerase sigma-70 factor, ECF subfamily